MSIEERIGAILELEEWYSKEFSESGLDNLTVEIKSNKSNGADH